MDALESRLREFIFSQDKHSALVLTGHGKMIRTVVAVFSYAATLTRGPGIYLSVERPHTYMKILLKKKGIPSENLYFIDLMTRAGPRKKTSTISVSGFFWVKLMANQLDNVFDSSGKPCSRLPIESVRFMVLDNVSLLPVYLSPQVVREFFTEYRTFLKSNPGIKSVMVSQSDTAGETLEVIRESADYVIDVSEV